jgi:hypothetical protein
MNIKEAIGFLEANLETMEDERWDDENIEAAKMALHHLRRVQHPDPPAGYGEITTATCTNRLVLRTEDLACQLQNDGHHVHQYWSGEVLITWMGGNMSVPANLRHLEQYPTCSDCPIGGQDGSGPVCKRAPLCDWECKQQVEALK